MKTIGLLGGMSWESTVPYYRIINETVKEKLGGLHSAKLFLHSVDFDEIAQLQRAGEWDEAASRLARAARSLRLAGADFLVICTNTMHIVADAIAAQADMPVFHIVDPTGQEIRRSGLTKVGLIGTRFTMEKDFYKDRMRERHSIECVVPDEADLDVIHSVIFEELCRGVVREESRQAYRAVICRLAERGAQGIIFGCT
ncbi:aspartate/glutamate racemase family protein, partial [Noviherbaspirillum denitrificans]|uniref:aspartate/glutamate racemase family protein n=1 Tax=Noviherbaspirillum denitrificans TaxID=1968433 RepID=UPI000B52E8BA